MQKAILRNPDKTITLTKEQLSYFVPFLNQKSTEAFTGNYFFKHQETRERLMQFCIVTLGEKCLLKSIHANRDLPSKKIKIKVNYGEEISLLNVYNRGECSPYMEALMSQIAAQLKSEKVFREVYSKYPYIVNGSGTKVERKWNESRTNVISNQ